MIINSLEMKPKETLTVEEANAMYLKSGIISVCKNGSVEKFDYDTTTLQ